MERGMKDTVTVSAKGQIVIPQEVRERLRIKPGAKLRLRLRDTFIELSPLPEDLVGYLCGVVNQGPSLADVLLAEREADRAREEREVAGFARGAKVPAKGKRL